LTFINLGWKDVIYSEIIDLEETGLEFNNDEELLGNPLIWRFKIKFLFREGEGRFF
jgi:hypothetical protein